ncbi:MAG: glycosyltransferase family 39 protein [Candidatus Rokubacteria bacterium]|nr:glycosyltransferase family 39 protein [Candidatus Rokubacteria bacterium]
MLAQSPARSFRIRAALASLASWPIAAARWFVRARWLQVSLIVLLGALLRFWGVFHGWKEDFVYHPDAATLTVPDAWGLYVRDEWVGLVWKTDAPLYMFLHAAAIRAVAGVAGFLAIPVPWTMPFVAAIGSGLSAALGTLTVWVVYGIGRLAYSHTAGIVAAVFLAVSPLHSLHSHYPYPDSAMTWLLALALLVAVTVLHQASLPRSLLSAGLAGAAAAAKIGGIAGAPAVVLALFLGWRRRIGTLWALGAAGLLTLLVALTLQGLTFGGYQSPWGVMHRIRSELASLWGVENAGERLSTVLGTLAHGMDAGQLVLAGLGVLVAVWRRAAFDWVLLTLIASLGVVLFRVPVPDDRFLVPVTVAFVLLGGRTVAEALRLSGGRVVPVTLIVVVFVMAAFPSFHSSYRQGLFLTLPDTRYLAGLWFQAHVPPRLRVAIEGYWPLGVNERPGAAYFDARKPLAEQTERFDLLATSSLEHGRYVERPAQYPQIAAFFRDLPRSAHLVRSFELFPIGFAHSTIRVWWPAAGPGASTVRPYLPRPFDDSWNGGVSWLGEAPYDKDDRTWWIRGGYQRSVTLVSHRPFETVGVFLRNGTAPSRVRIRTGLTVRSRWVAPYGRTLVTFRPTALTWQPPYVVPLRISVGSGDGVLIQVRHGARAIGETYWAWGEWDQAIPWLEEALQAGVPDPEALFLLAVAYAQTGQVGTARDRLALLTRGAPDFVSELRALAGAEDGPAFDRAFPRVTGLNPELLRYSLSTTFEAEDFPRLTGEVALMAGASANQVVVVPPSRSPSPRVVTYGPYTYLPWGAYLAVFRVRGLGPAGSDGPLLEVQAGDTLLARMAVPGRRMASDQFEEIAVPFRHPRPEARVEFRVVARGGGGVAVDAVRLFPDLRALVQMKLEALAPVSGQN